MCLEGIREDGVSDQPHHLKFLIAGGIDDREASDNDLAIRLNCDAGRSNRSTPKSTFVGV